MSCSGVGRGVAGEARRLDEILSSFSIGPRSGCAEGWVSRVWFSKHPASGTVVPSARRSLWVRQPQGPTALQLAQVCLVISA